MGEVFDFDSLERFGWPWHGVYRGGALYLPNGESMQLPGQAEPSMGDSLVVMVPGRPEVETSQSDAAIGYSWLNYGVVAGVEHALYGKELGKGAWVYVADDGSAWVATAVIANSGGATITLVGIMDSSVTQILEVSCSGAAGIRFPTTIVAFEDAARSGRRAVFAWRLPDFLNAPVDPYVPWEAEWRYTRGVAFAHAEISISGTPPNATATFDLKVIKGSAVDGAESDFVLVFDTRRYVSVYDDEDPDLLLSTTGGGILEQIQVVAMTYDADDVLQKVIVRTRWTTTNYAMTLSGEEYYYSGSYQHRRNLEIGGLSGFLMISDYAWSGTVEAPQLTTTGGWEQVGDDCVCYGNKAFGLYEVSESEGWRFSYPMTWAVAPDGYVVTGSAVPPYAAAHPFTGSVLLYGEDAVVV